MKIKNFAKWSMFGLCAAATLGCVGCGGQEELVTFGQYSGTYDTKSYSVAASTWEKQENEEGFDGVWKLTGLVKYDNNTGKALYYGSADTHYYVAITVKPDKDVTPQDPTYKVDSRTLKPFDNGNENTFTLIKAISAESKDFTLTINWNPETTVKYKFVINQADFTLEENHA